MDNYERTKLIITEFDVEDIITTSGEDPVSPPPAYDPYEGIFG